ncbi:polyprenyl synthetase family protein [Lysinibacillus sp. NPDC094403]|uniref:polyprenyl synthetase family protein n=1 Tax=Lysinibacillus sp. NPDC094403 TaxID=3390581 RepID=UPI003D03726A
MKLLYLEGKIFSVTNSYFTWSEFSFYVSSLLDNKTPHLNRIAQSAAIELLILSTDILDDLIDNDFKRETLNILTKPQAIMLSNALLMESLNLLLQNTKRNPNEIFSLINENLINANNGQWDDLFFTLDKPGVSEELYFQLIQQKSSSLIKLIFDLNNLYSEKISVLKEISMYIGYAGQIRNDVKDIFSTIKNDLIEKKATLPLIKALEYSQEKDNGFLLQQLQTIEVNKENQVLLNAVKKYITKTGAVDYCLILSKLYINRAKELLLQHYPNSRLHISYIIKLID